MRTPANCREISRIPDSDMLLVPVLRNYSSVAQLVPARILLMNVSIISGLVPAWILIAVLVNSDL
jgi:hypothetical protein